MQVVHLHAHLAEVVGEILSHLLRQGRDDGPLPACDPGVDLAEQVVDLALGRPDVDLGVHETGRPDDLLHQHRRPFQLVGPGGGGDEDGLVEPLLEFLECERPVIERARQAEAVLHEDVLAGLVAEEHPAGLRDRHVRLVDEHQEVGREVVEQRPRPAAGGSAGQVP